MKDIIKISTLFIKIYSYIYFKFIINYKNTQKITKKKIDCKVKNLKKRLLKK